ncbi:universal stress protein [Natrarchaeobaculum aegyptiacum]|uniref:Universal stress protein UspA n=1 Tax=Natrarchaeobaculum aegyptiacum TaxID=745377 RepID=A0A2Z2HW39_9EURY|nr:universal stress protein [Natrarchaeobaculum aegyptiacum]ARS91023.1 universal stress protein UspA [Natrarchaeobaculum aegyptiacum]
MDAILVVLLDESPDEELLAAANRHCLGTDTTAVVSRFVDEARYQSSLQQDVRSGNDLEDVDDLEERARETAAAVASQAFDDAVETSALGVVGTLPESVLETAAESDCGQVFLTGRRRSPVGKAVFGDVAQQIMLEFDGPVTITTVGS